NSDVFAKDLLFATLDPTMRKIVLPGGQSVILSDTVGFISDLPTELVAAFRATLEEVLEADLIVHVRDIIHSDTEAQKKDVFEVLERLGVKTDDEAGYLEVLNKIDLLMADEKLIVLNNAERHENSIAISAVSGEGAEAFLALVEKKLTAKQKVISIDLPAADGATLSWIYRHGNVLDRSDQEDRVTIDVKLSDEDRGRLEKMLNITL
ncbi:MAG: GTPase HflX, partial [Sneathiella sp.]